MARRYTEHTGLVLTPEQRQRLAATADAQGVTLSTVIRWAVDNYLTLPQVAAVPGARPIPGHVHASPYEAPAWTVNDEPGATVGAPQPRAEASYSAPPPAPHASPGGTRPWA